MAGLYQGKNLHLEHTWDGGGTDLACSCNAAGIFHMDSTDEYFRDYQCGSESAHGSALLLGDNGIDCGIRPAVSGVSHSEFS